MSPCCKVAFCTVASIFAADVALPAAAQQPTESKIVSMDNARQDKGNWGSIKVYFEGETSGVTHNFAATVTLKPGSEIYPPHVHAEEEYLLITQGSGTWTLGDKSFAAKAGDMLYAAPWVNHGLRNGSNGQMTFVVWK